MGFGGLRLRLVELPLRPGRHQLLNLVAVLACYCMLVVMCVVLVCLLFVDVVCFLGQAKSIPFTQARALQSGGRNCSPASDSVLRKLCLPARLRFRSMLLFIDTSRYSSSREAPDSGP